MTGPGEAAVREFLDELDVAGAPEGLSIVITREMPRRNGDGTYRESQWFRPVDVGRIPAFLARCANQRNMHLSIGLQHWPTVRERLTAKRTANGDTRPVLAEYTRGTAATVAALPAIVADVDVLNPAAHSATNLPRTIEEALALVFSLPCPPSAIVATGNGIQPWWIFRELWVFESDEDRERAAALARGLQGMLRAEAEPLGWQIDPTADLVRLCRVPGTLNHKSSPPKAVSLIRSGGPKYNPSELEEWVPEAVKVQARRQWKGKPYDGPSRPASLEPVVSGCAWMRHCREDARTLGEPEWYAALSVLARCEGGREAAHEWSKPHPGYTAEETDRKLAQAATVAGPVLCSRVAGALNAGRHCTGCVALAHGAVSPISLGHRGTGAGAAAIKEEARGVLDWLKEGAHV